MRGCGRRSEETPGVDLDRLVQVLKMTRLEAMGNRGRGGLDRPGGHRSMGARARAGDPYRLKEMRRGGVDIDRAPQKALDLLIEARMPVEDYPEVRAMGGRR